MKSGLQRRVALKLCSMVMRALPVRFQSWGLAITSEVAAIDDDTEALLFAFNSLTGIVRNFLADLFARMTVSTSISSGRTPAMSVFDNTTASPSVVGIACAISATMLGIAYMVMGGAPYGYLGINFGALLIGLVLLAVIVRAARTLERWSGPAMAAIGLFLLATALLGVELDGVSRWVKIGGLSVQPGLVLVPMMTVWFVRSHGPLAMFGMIATAAALALQPDRAMAATLAAGTLVLLFSRSDFRTVAVAMCGAFSFLATMITPDPMPAMAYVDQIIFRSFDISLWAGSAVIGGLALLALPAIFGLRLGAEMRSTSLVFAAIWLTMIIAAALGNYPTPVVGYSGGAVLGYVLSLAMFPIIERCPVAPDEIKEEPVASSNLQDMPTHFAAA